MAQYGFDSSNDSEPDAHYQRTLRRVLLTIVALVLIALFVIWRIQSDRIERLRAELLNMFMPSIRFGLQIGEYISDIGAVYYMISEASRNAEELESTQQSLREWRNYAQHLEQENATLKKLVNLTENTGITSITSTVLADTSSPFGNSILLNIGSENGIENGWMATDGVGVVGRVSSVSRTTSRVLLITDTSSRIPIQIQPSGVRAIAVGDNTINPVIELVGNTAEIEHGSRVITSGDGGVFPSGYLLGTIGKSKNGRLRIIPAANYSALSIVSLINLDKPETVRLDSKLLIPDKIDQQESKLEP